MGNSKQNKGQHRLLDFLRGRESNPPEDFPPHQTVVIPETQLSKALQSCLPPGLQNRYQVRRVLGKGGFGVVSFAKDLRIGRLVAIKQLYRHLELDPRIYERFLQEARIAGRLSHPNIVTIYTVEEVTDSCCIVMEYLGGGNVAELIRTTAGGLPPAAAVDVVLSVLEGLRTAHSMGVVHRDMKPENVLFDNTGVPKISDFGLAHLPLEAGGVDDVPGEVVTGTPCYMAPEQLAGDSVSDPRTDLYAMGIITAELVVGVRVFDWPGLRRQFEPEDLVLIPDLIAAELRTRKLPSAFVDILLKLIQPNPNDRYHCVADVIHAFAEWRKGVSAVDSRVSHHGARFARNNTDILTDILELLLSDGVLNPDERAELQRRIDRLGIDNQTARQIEESIRRERGLPSLAAIQEFTGMLQDKMASGDLSQADRAALRARAEKLGIGPKQQSALETQIRQTQS